MKNLVILFIAIRFASLVFGATDKIICYYGSWAIYRRGIGRVAIQDINPFLCTHMIYSFINLNARGGVVAADPTNDIFNGGFKNFTALKQKNPKLKTLVGIGGANAKSKSFSDVVNSPILRNVFINNLFDFVLKYNFDGLDLDWEYPAQGGGVPSDKSGFIELIKGLRTKFNEKCLLLTAAVGATDAFFETSYDAAQLGLYLDFINVMTYDFHGSWDDVTGQNSALYKSYVDVNQQYNVDYAIQSWIRAVGNRQKIILGVGLYGRSFTLTNVSQNVLGSPTKGPGLPGPYTEEAGLLNYMEICYAQKTPTWTTYFHTMQMNPYTFKGDQWIGYDNPRSVTLKAQYAVNNTLGGVMVWALDYDDVKNNCGGGNYPLLVALGKVIRI